MVELSEVLPEFCVVNEGIFLVPFAVKPIEVKVFVQLKVAPLGLLLKLIGALVVPLQMD